MLRPRGLPDHLAELDRTLVMGVLNVTPDSFSDGGRYAEVERAVEHGLAMAAAGADVVDVGGESTRPGSERITAAEELDRVLPVISGLVKRGVAVSIDTMRPDVATAALEVGAMMINDISGGKADPSMLQVVAAAEVPFVLMHWRGPSNIMATLTDYRDVAADVADELALQVDAAVAAGIARNRIAVDPGIGFAKTPDQNWPILQQLEQLDALELPVLWGVSRKRFLGELLADRDGELRSLDQREAATVALTTYLALAGAWAVRVHEVRGSRDAVEVVKRLVRD